MLEYVDIEAGNIYTNGMYTDFRKEKLKEYMLVTKINTVIMDNKGNLKEAVKLKDETGVEIIVSYKYFVKNFNKKV